MEPPDDWASSPPPPHIRAHGPGEGSQGGGQDTHLLTHPGLGPRLLPVAAGRTGGALGLGFPRAEGSTAPRVEAITARRVASCPHGCGQQAAEAAAPEGAGSHGGALRGGPQRHIPAWPLAPLSGAGDAAAPRDSAGWVLCPASCSSPQPHASFLAAWPDPSPPPLSSSGSCPSLPRFLPLSYSPLLRGVCSLCPPGLLCLVPAPLRCCFLGLHPLAPAGPPLVSLSVFPSDRILEVTGLCPCGC